MFPRIPLFGYHDVTKTASLATAGGSHSAVQSQDLQSQGHCVNSWLAKGHIKMTCTHESHHLQDELLMSTVMYRGPTSCWWILNCKFQSNLQPCPALPSLTESSPALPFPTPSCPAQPRPAFLKHIVVGHSNVC